MPEVLDIVPKDIHAIISFPLVELKKLKLAIGMSEIQFDGSKPEEKAASEYLKEYYAFVDKLIEEVEGGSRSY